MICILSLKGLDAKQISCLFPLKPFDIDSAASWGPSPVYCIPNELSGTFHCCTFHLYFVMAAYVLRLFLVPKNHPLTQEISSEEKCFDKRTFAQFFPKSRQSIEYECL